jgi:transposase-like protein
MNRIPKARYTQKVREEAVNLARAVGASEASRRLSISLKTLANWIRAGNAGQLSELSKHPPAASEVELELELARVKRKLADLAVGKPRCHHAM